MFCKVGALFSSYLALLAICLKIVSLGLSWGQISEKIGGIRESIFQKEGEFNKKTDNNKINTWTHIKLLRKGQKLSKIFPCKGKIIQSKCIKRIITQAQAMLQDGRTLHVLTTYTHTNWGKYQIFVIIHRS